MTGRPRRRIPRPPLAAALVGLVALAAVPIVLAGVGGRRPGAAASQATPYQSAAATAIHPPSAARAQASLSSSPPPLAALHRRRGRLLAGDLDRRLGRLRGFPVVVNAWASWCAPCRDELPLLSRASARFGRRVAFLGADVDDEASGARRLLAAARPSYPSYRATAASIRSLTPLVGFPTTIYLDRRGRVIYSHQGQYPSIGVLAGDVRRYALAR